MDKILHDIFVINDVLATESRQYIMYEYPSLHEELVVDELLQGGAE